MIQINMQEPEGRVDRADGVLEVVDVFYTIQGEGPFAGEPAVFVRLAGCNLQCPDCDTDYTTGRFLTTPHRLVAVAQSTIEQGRNKLGRPPWKQSLVVITGGEPFRQNLAPAVKEFLSAGFKVQIETNGTYAPLPGDFPFAAVTLVVSPKVGRVHPDLMPHVRHLKYVIEAGRESDPRTGLPLRVLGNDLPVQPPPPDFRGTIWVQPADMQNDECNKANVEAAVDLAMKYGYRVSLQTHKILGVK